MYIDLFSNTFKGLKEANAALRVGGQWDNPLLPRSPSLLLFWLT